MARLPRLEGTRRARELRRQATLEERLLWHKLRQGQLGHDFRQQQLMGFYIADFVCFERQLVIEVDGGQHLNNANDVVRDQEMQARGFRVLRFWNSEVKNNMSGVLERIAAALAG